MFSRLLLSWLFVNASCRTISNHHLSSPSSPTHQERIFQFAQNGTSIENLAVRSNGNILFTLTGPAAEVWQVEGKAAHLVANFTAQSSTLGITEVEHDVFAVISGDIFIANTWVIHTIDFNSIGKPRISLAASVPDVTLLNGLTTLDSKAGEVLASESVIGRVYSINVRTGESRVVLDDASMQPDPNGFVLGINGMRKVGNYLYYINSSIRALYRVIINPDGSPAGDYELIADLSALQDTPDDFAVREDGTAFVSGSNEVILVRPDGRAAVFAGGQDETEFAGTTSAVFGRDRQSLYVSSSGGGGGTFMEPGFIDILGLGPVGHGW